MRDDEEIEERVEQTEIAEAAGGRRWQFAIAMVALGVCAVVGSIVLAILAEQVPAALCVALAVGGFAMAIGFGYVAAGTTKLGVAGGREGVSATARLPRPKRVTTTILRRKGLEPLDEQPPDDGS